MGKMRTRKGRLYGSRQGDVAGNSTEWGGTEQKLWGRCWRYGREIANKSPIQGDKG